MTLDDFIDDMNSFVDSVDKELPDWVGEAGVTAKSLIQDRVQETGVNASGSVFGEYAEKTKRIRSSKGRQTAYVDMTFTGRMWANIKMTGVERRGDNVVAIIGPGNAETQNKLLYNSGRYGTILDLNDQEENDIGVIVESRVQETANRIFG